MQGPVGEAARKWAERLRRMDGVSIIEKLVLALLAIQAARLIWVLLTPVGSFGIWSGSQARFPSPAARQALFANFDPFFRAAPQQESANVVTSLALTLYGVRLNEGTGLGSAIIAGSDGVQNSFAVGDEITSGVVLKAVSFDHVTIDRGGSEEQLFLDQSQSAPDAEQEERSTAAHADAAPPAGRDNPTADSIRQDVGFTPRTENGRITGLILTAKGPGFENAGFQPGDIITQVDGQSIGSASDLQALRTKIAPGARVSLTVERGASTATINLMLQGQ
ncbi:type II secretion system protein N [Sphingobium cloacae]|uniref:Type II secretory pathway component PulC n=1 Tax=Sphingobium cloacae TaxID=120107 RepID=A0A1E1F0Q2_9SPHN|nr:type II secretion system protein N [Sphingobium cloacae]BAV64031.1 type II secretory pathway component PulC [Sphingobium cloacae]